MSETKSCGWGRCEGGPEDHEVLVVCRTRLFWTWKVERQSHWTNRAGGWVKSWGVERYFKDDLPAAVAHVEERRKHSSSLVVILPLNVEQLLAEHALAASGGGGNR